MLRTISEQDRRITKLERQLMMISGQQVVSV